jgi:diguanylate cyclase (GGDEF)-like protein/PAS domain S-box-containing protein
MMTRFDPKNQEAKSYQIRTTRKIRSEMFQVYTCLTNDNDWRLVMLAGAVCFLASAVAVVLFHRAQATTGRTQFVWLTLDAAAAGCGIWATHFIAMLAYDPAIGADYNLAMTILSLFIAVLITGAGLATALLDFGRWTAAFGGAVVGGGITAMHYTGMLALEVPGRMTWTPNLVVASIALGIAFGSIAIHFAARRDDLVNTSIATVLLALAILLMHFTGMGAVRVVADPTRINDAAALSPAALALVIAGIAAIVLGVCLVAALSDRQLNGKLQQQKILLDTALENMSQGLCMFGPDGRIVLFNERYATMMGLPAAWFKGRSLLDLFKLRKESGDFVGDPEEYFARVRADAREGKSAARVTETSAGRVLRVADQPMQDGGWVATFEDITEWQEAQAQISHMAHHDALTGLANRTQLVEKLQNALTDLPSRGGGIAVHFIDLDRFKSVNDTLGHDGGDFLLKIVAERLRSVTRVDDVVARLGGDEFVVVQTQVNGKNQAEDFARRLAFAVTAPMKLREQVIVATISVGIALAPADGTNPERLLKSADLALYKAKADGRNCIRFFLAEMDTELQERFKLETIIREAVLHDRFELHYQPLFEISERRLIGFEALIRLPAEDGTLIPPLTFIPVAEDLRLIDKIGAWVLREACRTAATWPENLTVAVNLSPAQFLMGSVSDIVAAALKETGLAAHRLELEITETLLLGNSKAIMTELQTLKAMGVAIVMDDFGTGYSSLSYLWRFPFDKIKIDRSFMQGFDGSGRDVKTVVKTIIALGRELNMRVTVEGVETATQAAFLDKADGDQAQGFFFGRPVPAAEVSANILADFRKTQLALSPSAGSKSKRLRALSSAE